VRSAFPLLRALLLCAVACLVLVPLVAVALGGFKTIGELRVNPFGLPSLWVWGNYATILGGARLWRSLANSAFLSLATVLLSLVVSVMAAFAFSHIRFVGRRFLFSYFLIGLLFPAAAQKIMPAFPAA